MAAQTSASGSHVRPLALAPAPVASGQPTPPLEATTEQTMPYTCVTCARRKVKCDKIHPVCSTCRKGGHECVYEAPPPRKRKRRNVDDVLEKLEQYERLLKSHGIRPSENAESLHGTSPIVATQPESSAQDQPTNFYTTSIRAGKLLASSGKSRYIDSPLWTNLAEVSEEQFHPSEDEEEDESNEQNGRYDAAGLADPISASLLGPTSPYHSLVVEHPTYDYAMKLWKVYCANVDPLLKITHVPTGLVVVQRAAANPGSVSKPIECLLFAIYHFGVLSMTDVECQQLLGQPRELLLNRYHDAARQALTNASFLRTTDMVVLQAFTLFLVSTRTRYDPHTFWILTGVCVRIAQRMGLHRDGEQLGMKPFDVQMRRRLYWQILPMDGFAAQLCGASIAYPSGGFDTKAPLNINDADLWPDMTETPIEKKGATDMIFCQVRAEVGKFHQRMRYTGNQGLMGRLWQAKDVEEVSEIESKLDELENIMEEKYLRYIDFVIPTHCLAQAMARTALCAGRFRVRVPFVTSGDNAEETKRTRAKLFDLALRVVDYHIAANINPIMKRFHWHLRSFFQWEALIWLLDCIKQRYDFIDVPAVWSKIQELYKAHPEWLTQKRSLHIALGKLTLRAWEAQPVEYRAANSEPLVVQTLRESFAKAETPRTEPPPPPLPYNAFDPAKTDETIPDLGYMAAPNAEVDFNLINGFNPDTMDWMFWDQMIKDQQDTFSIVSATGMAQYD